MKTEHSKIFIDNEYYIAYFNIIDEIKNREPLHGFSETHHIIPRSFGGTNESNNLIIVTPKEHFRLHELLPLFSKGRLKYKMAKAYFLMNRILEKNISWDAFNKIKEINSAGQKYKMQGKVITKNKISGEIKLVPREQFENDINLVGHNHKKIFVRDIDTETKYWVSKETLEEDNRLVPITKGITSWNAGKTKDNDERVLAISKGCIGRVAMRNGETKFWAREDEVSTFLMCGCKLKWHN